jgi:hypothetical protein
METVWLLALVLIVCIVGHVSSVWWLSSLLGRSAEDIDERIAGIDNGLGFLAQKLLDPGHWEEILGTVRPESNPIEMLLNHFMNSPREDYTRDDDGRFYGGATEVIETTGTETEDGNQPPRNG